MHKKKLEGITSSPRVTCKELLKSLSNLDLKILAGERGMKRMLSSPHIQKPGLSLAGFVERIQSSRVQVLGHSEIAFLESLPESKQRKLILSILRDPPPCFFLSRSLSPPKTFLKIAEGKGVTIVTSKKITAVVIRELTDILQRLLAQTFTTHGVLVDVGGVGILINGEGSIGKSECALELIFRGHRFIADDLVEIRRLHDTLIGSSPQRLRNYMELRGLGIINIQDLFGVSSVKREHHIDMVAELKVWNEKENYDRLGLEDERIEILDMEIPYILIPVSPGRNISMLIEVAGRELLLKQQGVNHARSFIGRMERGIRKP